MKKLIIIFLIVLSVLAYMQIKGWIAEGGPLLNVTNVVVPKGASLKTVAEELSRAGVIDKPWLFRIMARINGLAKHLKAGEYQFMPAISLQAAMDKIARGEVFFRRITIPEGLTSGQIMYLIANYPDLEGEIDLDVKEGELLPETYSFELGASRNSIILQARAAMQKALEEVWASRDSSLPLKDVNELLTLASIIEKETGVPEERPLVASVFLNRLKKGMRLQTDPTVIYAITEGETSFGRSLKRADLKIDSPYNTYLNYGLPPGPICNPGREALMAAARPQQSDYLYFVADGKGGHRFARSLNEHNRNVKAWVRSIRN
ncbi:MAG TPA: endolytic transglycosylase MltG [Candidatus Scatocola faecigallinarum]|nr:endolytic transglycosylase MltG [Candidatus Scatocola faecigallinarum]